MTGRTRGGLRDGATTQLVPNTEGDSAPDLSFKSTSRVPGGSESEVIPFRARSGAAIEKRLLAYRLQQRLFGITDTDLKIGHYTLVRKLGEGGMGVVYVAVDERLNREVALKLLNSKDSESAQGTLRLLREARAMAKVAHPNVVGVYEMGESDGCIYISMELIKGVTLREWMSDDTRPWTDVVDAFVQAGAGLAAAHRSGLVHRDFKPENVMIGHDGRVKVLDFGLAFARAALVPDQRGFPAAARPKAEIFAQVPCPRIDERITEPNVLMGTIAYMSPEQFHESAVDAASDQFSFCVALFEALYRVPPFAGRTYFEIVGNVFNNRMTEIPTNRPSPGWITAVLLKGLSIDPRKRYASIAELTSILSAGRRSTVKISPRHGSSAARDRPSAPGFDAFDGVPLAGFVHPGVGVDTGVALRIALGLTDAVHDLARLGFSTRDTTFESILVGVTDHRIKVFDPATEPADGSAQAGNRYRIVGLALLGLLTSRPPDLTNEVSARSLLDGDDVTRKLPDQLRRIIEKILDPRRGYRSAKRSRPGWPAYAA